MRARVMQRDEAVNGLDGNSHHWRAGTLCSDLAAGLGVPAVATTVGGLPEMVVAGVSGELVPPKIRRLWLKRLPTLLRQSTFRLTNKAQGNSPKLRFRQPRHLKQSAWRWQVSFRQQGVEMSDAKFEQLASGAESLGWANAYFNHVRTLVAGGSVPVEDLRAADWMYLLSLNKGLTALVLGCGEGVIPFALSEVCGQVYAVDQEANRLRFLRIRARQEGIENLYTVHANQITQLPFPEKHFDLIVFRDFLWSEIAPGRFENISSYLCRLLKENGVAYFNVSNRTGFQRLLGRERRSSWVSTHTLPGYRRILRATGFTDLEFYAPLPYYDGIPLFFVGLEHADSSDFFLRSLFPLFEAVSPEVKRKYAVEYRFAKVGASLALTFRLAGLVPFFVSGYGIIARRTPPRHVA